MGDRVVTVRLVLENLPPRGFADGCEGRIRNGRAFEPGQRVGDDLVFTVPLRVRASKNTGAPNFLGGYAIGPVDERHLYVGWGWPDGDGFRIRRGVKVFLVPVTRAKWSRPGITWDQIEAGAVETRVPAVDPTGEPVCAGVPSDWVISR